MAPELGPGAEDTFSLGNFTLRDEPLSNEQLIRWFPKPGLSCTRAKAPASGNEETGALPDLALFRNAGANSATEQRFLSSAR